MCTETLQAAPGPAPSFPPGMDSAALPPVPHSRSTGVLVPPPRHRMSRNSPVFQLSWPGQLLDAHGQCFRSCPCDLMVRTQARNAQHSESKRGIFVSG